ncbi:mandelate racemase/muconate lactonizing enzyme family protein [Pelagibacterium sp. H642]|uniref:mandelate racemase/muconate lactonizing enzyme family protein n=1 Tax=Pelagibacterium sp. H642 TaxID=1881069 RepID=UPI00281510D6|nr:mandelate racemase/muconate lactonizing enzyme family protein [Pelagibacterium sp. H642]WMT91888.1 mandelate racemase/muconate lactonizing enzyme family protein [Pelagibacterium sp. H642]
MSHTAPIISLKTFPISIPFADGGKGTGATPSRWHTLDMVLVRIEDEDGHVGWGDSFSYFCTRATHAAITDMIAPSVVGRVIGDIPAWNVEVQKKLHLFGRYGITTFALSGVDIALWDLKARRAGKSLASMVAGSEQTPRSIPAYASLVRYGDIDLVRQHCQRAVDLGFHHIKLHEIEPDIIAAAREVIGPDAALMVDANCAWTLDEAIAQMPSLRASNVLWVEEPVFPPDDYASHRRIEAARMAVGAGENASTAFDFARLSRAVQFPQPSMTKVGGVSEFAQIVHDAGALGKSVMPHSPYFGPGFFATLAMAPLLPQDSLFEYLFVDPQGWLQTPPVLMDGRMMVPAGAGTGFVPDPNIMDRFAISA